MAKTEFIPGLLLSRGFFDDLVQPLLAKGFPRLRYSAALIGTGSEVLGFDTEMSADHHWGPRVMLFLEESDLSAHGDAIRNYLSRNLPASYRGYSTSFSDPDPTDHGVRHLVESKGGAINHRAELFTVDGFFESYLKLPVRREPSVAEWLVVPFQKLRSVVAGEVFRDDLSLNRVRKGLAWYPHDVWLYLLGSCWTRIGQEEHLMGRAGMVGDEIGSSLIGARLVRDIMLVAFLLERDYPPYAKWLGTAFARLQCATELRPHLEAALQARAWQERESALAAAYEALVRVQADRAIAVGDSPRVGQFWGRPFRVIHAERIAEAVFADIAGGAVSALARERPFGNIDLLSDNTDLLSDSTAGASLRVLYEQPIRREATEPLATPDTSPVAPLPSCESD